MLCYQKPKQIKFQSLRFQLLKYCKQVQGCLNKSIIIIIIIITVRVRACVQGSRCCGALPRLLPMMSGGDNCRKRTGRMSYLFVAGFPSLPLSHVSSGSEPFAQCTGCNTETTRLLSAYIFWFNITETLLYPSSFCGWINKYSARVFGLLYFWL